MVRRKEKEIFFPKGSFFWSNKFSEGKKNLVRLIYIIKKNVS